MTPIFLVVQKIRVYGDYGGYSDRTDPIMVCDSQESAEIRCLQTLVLDPFYPEPLSWYVIYKEEFNMPFTYDDPVVIFDHNGQKLENEPNEE